MQKKENNQHTYKYGSHSPRLKFMVKLVALPKFKSKEDMVFFWSRTWLTQNRLHVCWFCSSQVRLETILHLVACTIHLTTKNATKLGKLELIK